MNLAVARRKHNAASIRAIRSMTAADIDIIRAARTPVDPIKVIRDRHHHIAWLIALGKSQVDISAEVGMSQSRISILMRDPTFRELVERRRAELNEIRRDHTENFVAKATRAMVLAEEEVARRLTEDPTSIATRDLNRIAADRMDRFGYGKHSTSESRNVNINFGAKLEAAIERSRKVT